MSTLLNNHIPPSESSGGPEQQRTPMYVQQKIDPVCRSYRASSAQSNIYCSKGHHDLQPQKNQKSQKLRQATGANTTIPIALAMAVEK